MTSVSSLSKTPSRTDVPSAIAAQVTARLVKLFDPGGRIRPTTFPTVSNDNTLGSIPFKNRLPTGSDRSSKGTTGKSLCLNLLNQPLPARLYRRQCDGHLGTPHPSIPNQSPTPIPTFDRFACGHFDARLLARSISLPSLEEISSNRNFLQIAPAGFSPPCGCARTSNTPCPPPMDPRCHFSRSDTAN
jgi:hypothetical protein